MHRISDYEVADFWTYKLFNIDIKYNLKPLEVSSIPDAWAKRVANSYHKTGFICLGEKYTFGQIDELSDLFAMSLLKNKSLSKGDKIAIMMPNTLQYLVALLGILKSGLIVVNCNPLYTKDELSKQINDSKAKIIITLENVCKPTADALNEGLIPSVQEVIVTKLGDHLPIFKKHLVNFIVKNVKKMVPQYSFTNSVTVTPFLDMIKRSYKNDRKLLDKAEKEITLNDTAFLQYTGGTTGISKGAVLSHKNILINSIQIEQASKFIIEKNMLLRAQSQGITEFHALIPLPFYHIYALTCGLLTLMVNFGVAVSTLPNPRDFKALIKLFDDDKIVLISLISTLAKALVKNDNFKKIKLNKNTLVIAGGMPTDKDVAEEWFHLTGTKITEGYGMTETSPLISLNDVFNPKPGVAGYPVPQTLVKLRDDYNNDIPLGLGKEFPGELLVKGPQMMDGYYNNPDENSKIFTDDGFIATGDIATISADGSIDVVDRKKDMILVSGFNVYPSEIESKAMKTGLILECAAIAMPDDKTGEKVVLVAVPINSTVDKKSFMAILNSDLTNYKRPSLIVFADVLPKSPVGKILKKDIRNNFNSYLSGACNE